MSAAAVRGMVQAYTGARTVSLARCAGQLRHAVDFENMFRAVSQGAKARSQGQLLGKLNLKGCIAIRDDDITSLCSTLESLRLAASSVAQLTCSLTLLGQVSMIVRLFQCIHLALPPLAMFPCACQEWQDSER